MSYCLCFVRLCAVTQLDETAGRRYVNASNMTRSPGPLRHVNAGRPIKPSLSGHVVAVRTSGMMTVCGKVFHSEKALTNVYVYIWVVAQIY